MENQGAHERTEAFLKLAIFKGQKSLQRHHILIKHLISQVTEKVAFELENLEDNLGYRHPPISQK